MTKLAMINELMECGAFNPLLQTMTRQQVINQWNRMGKDTVTREYNEIMAIRRNREA